MHLIDYDRFGEIWRSSPTSRKTRAECITACQLVLEESYKEADMLIRKQNILLITDQMESGITDSVLS